MIVKTWLMYVKYFIRLFAAIYFTYPFQDLMCRENIETIPSCIYLYIIREANILYRFLRKLCEQMSKPFAELNLYGR